MSSLAPIPQLSTEDIQSTCITLNSLLNDTMTDQSDIGSLSIDQLMTKLSSVTTAASERYNETLSHSQYARQTISDIRDEAKELHSRLVLYQSQDPQATRKQSRSFCHPRRLYDWYKLQSRRRCEDKSRIFLSENIPSQIADSARHLQSQCSKYAPSILDTAQGRQPCDSYTSAFKACRDVVSRCGED